MQSLLPASGVLYEITSMVRVEVKFIGSDRIGRYIATGKIGIGISVKWRIGATPLHWFDTCQVLYDLFWKRIHSAKVSRLNS